MRCQRRGNRVVERPSRARVSETYTMCSLRIRLPHFREHNEQGCIDNIHLLTDIDCCVSRRRAGSVCTAGLRLNRATGTTAATARNSVGGRRRNR